MSHSGDLVYGLEVGGDKHSELNASDVLSVLSDRAALLEALLTFVEVGDCKASRQEAEAAIAKATGQ
jgi:hypothetical protein